MGTLRFCDELSRRVQPPDAENRMSGGVGEVTGAIPSPRPISLIETCKATAIEPYTYLVDLFRQLPSAKTAEDFETLLPWNLATSAA